MSEPNLYEKVSTDRWQEAQHWERSHWVNAQAQRARYFKNHIWRALSTFGLREKHRGDDWNSWWKTAFQNYEFLPLEVDNAIEVGCGPYTNMRMIRERCVPRHLVLSDPLIRTYVNFKLTFVAEQYRQAACALDDHPIEELPFASDYFDLVVMINVLDHVRDARQCMESLLRVTRPGGWLIIGQDLTNEQDLAAMQGGEGEVGHPIKLSAEWFQQYLGHGFQPAIDRVLSREDGRAPEHHCGTLLFAGRKQPAVTDMRTHA